MEEVIISNPKEFEAKKKKFIDGGKENIHVLTDFDRTLTKAEVNGKQIPSVISILRDKDYIDKSYSEKSKALANKYRPIEMNPDVPLNEKKKAMKEWWTKHFDLLIKSGLNKSHLERIVKEEGIEFRKGALEFIDSLYQNNIPLVIISSSGVGETIPILLEREKKNYSNIHAITNYFKWDKNGQATGIKMPIIHVFNKDESSVKDYPAIYSKIKNRKNVILLGDSEGDLGMLNGVEHESVIKIGFLNENIEKNLNNYKKNFDVILLNDSNFSYINKMMQEIIT